MDDGSLDAPDDVLAGLDVVVASIHRGFKQDRAKITGRICGAMQNPYVHMVAHATGRLLGKRVAYDVDMDQVIRTAAATGTALEINSSPDRLDIDDKTTKIAKEAGAFIAVNTDAHSTLELANVKLGLTVARRGWLEKSDVVNTFKPEDLLNFLQKKRTACVT
jgi:DNA polymerase (family X)